MIVRSVILAAGQGTRMMSPLPKVLHPVAGQPMILFAVEVARQVTGAKPVLVIGFGADQVRDVVGDRADYVLQEQRLGTGHAVLQAEQLLAGQADYILITSGDMPLLTPTLLSRLVSAGQHNPGPLSMLTVIADDPRGFGRIVRNAQGHVQAVVEEVDANPEQMKIRELNAGGYCVRASWLWPALKRIPLSSKGEFFLTDLVGIAVQAGEKVQPVLVTDPSDVIGINTPIHLDEADRTMRSRLGKE